MSEFAASLGVSLPFIQAPMAGVQTSPLALAVSRAGGLGFLPGAMLTPEQLATELQTLQDSGLPYGVNFFAHRPAECLDLIAILPDAREPLDMVGFAGTEHV